MFRDIKEKADKGWIARYEQLKEKKVDGWVFNEKYFTLELYIDGRRRYEIDLETCNTSARILDWLCQLKSKLWLNSEHFNQFFEALNLLCGLLQSKLCGCGIDRPFNFKQAFLTTKREILNS